jgi:hypothetical protein
VKNLKTVLTSLVAFLIVIATGCVSCKNQPKKVTPVPTSTVPSKQVDPKSDSIGVTGPVGTAGATGSTGAVTAPAKVDPTAVEKKPATEPKKEEAAPAPAAVK